MDRFTSLVDSSRKLHEISQKLCDRSEAFHDSLKHLIGCTQSSIGLSELHDDVGGLQKSMRVLKSLEAALIALKMVEAGNTQKDSVNELLVKRIDQKVETSVATCFPGPSNAADVSEGSINPSLRKEMSLKESQHSASKQEKKTRKKLHFQYMHSVTSEEFCSIPSFTRGRISLDVLNEILGKLNALIYEKYAIMDRALLTLNGVKMSQYSTWLDQRHAELEGHFFIAENEFRSSLTSKFKLALRVAIPCLRCVKRVQTIRVKCDTFLIACHPCL